MDTDWMKLLYHYAKQYHLSLVHGRSRDLMRLVADEASLEQHKKLLKITMRERNLRGMKLQRSQTHAKIMQVLEHDEFVTVDLRFQITTSYEQWDENLQEERVLIERITLSRDAEGWRIAMIEQLTTEPRISPALRTEPAASDLVQAAPRPLLNTHLLYGSHPYDTQHGWRKTSYNRRRAVEYADKYWNQANPDYLKFEVDCTNYVSQCLLAGGAPMNYTGRREAGWWYQGRKNNREWWSYSWSVSNALHHYLMTSRSGLRAELVHTPYELDLGDVIIYDWDGDGSYQHSTIVTGFDAAGEPLVNAHSVNSRGRLWSYRDSPAWTEQTRYRFFHIADYF